MRDLKIVEGSLHLKENVEIIFERIVNKIGTSGKADVPKRYLGKRCYVVVLKD